jgi:hypothetical protein
MVGNGHRCRRPGALGDRNGRNVLGCCTGLIRRAPALCHPRRPGDCAAAGLMLAMPCTACERPRAIATRHRAKTKTPGASHRSRSIDQKPIRARLAPEDVNAAETASYLLRLANAVVRLNCLQDEEGRQVPLGVTALFRSRLSPRSASSIARSRPRKHGASSTGQARSNPLPSN